MKLYIEFIGKFQFRVFLEDANGNQAHLNFLRSNKMAMQYARPIARLLGIDIINLYE